MIESALSADKIEGEKTTMKTEEMFVCTSSAHPGFYCLKRL